ncbi:alpha/beta fold hydrolase [Alkalicoccobacillus gibsonii]|uniref:alpha/beta fold hydrolase n=1 Tax=Alkalicoccobacillus gibsonii TaxID=79881 RepID=UPI0019341F90|nr:alpha/beta hydrolase [Alkalicoccobacillus gibsonii]MBM0064041.1 alpha/beta hydrolase [Alkalicoccobacillus gibsonii]
MESKQALIVFIHGAGVGGWMWDKQVDHFSQSFDCFVPTYTFSKDQLVNEWADLFLTELQERMQKDQHVILIGFSMGSQIALEMCARKPDWFHLVMFNSGYIEPRRFLRKMVVPLMLLFNILPKSRAFSQKQAKELYIPDEHFEAYFAGAKNVTNAELQLIMNENLSYDLPDGLDRYKGKFLITIGEKEEKLLANSVQKIQQAVSQSELRSIPNVKHGFPLAKPDEFNTILEEWINK